MADGEDLVEAMQWLHDTVTERERSQRYGRVILEITFDPKQRRRRVRCVEETSSEITDYEPLGE